jgi:hypothetical protein
MTGQIIKELFDENLKYMDMAFFPKPREVLAFNAGFDAEGGGKSRRAICRMERKADLFI